MNDVFEILLTNTLYVIFATWFIVIVGMYMINAVANSGTQTHLSNQAQNTLEKTRNVGNESLQMLAPDEAALFEVVLPVVGGAITYAAIKNG